MSETGKAPNVIVLVDIETTGLNEKIDVPLELGVKVTDPNLTVLHQESWYIREEGWLEKIERNPLVLDMHEKSGLIDELVGLPEYRRLDNGQIMSWGSNQASFLAWRWLTEDLGLPSGEYPMCGSSVHFDRKFADKYLGVFSSFFSHRIIDVSTLKELAKIYRPDIYDAMKNDPRFDKKNTKHRSLADIDATLEELKQYLVDFLWLLDGAPGTVHKLGDKTDNMTVEEIDRNARAYGFEVGRGAEFKRVIPSSPDNPFMEKNWRDGIPEEQKDRQSVFPIFE